MRRIWLVTERYVLDEMRTRQRVFTEEDKVVEHISETMNIDVEHQTPMFSALYNYPSLTILDLGNHRTFVVERFKCDG